MYKYFPSAGRIKPGIIALVAGYLLICYASIFATASMVKELALDRPPNPWVAALIVDGAEVTDITTLGGIISSIGDAFNTKSLQSRYDRFVEWPDIDSNSGLDPEWYFDSTSEDDM